MKNMMLAALLAASTWSFGSFELLLVADAGTSTVHRFDSVTGSYFGSFGSGYLNAVTDMAIDSRSQSAFVLEGANRIYQFDYNTGLYLSSPQLGFSPLDIQGSQAGGFLAKASNISWRLYNAAASSFVTFNAPSGAVFGSATTMASGFTAIAESVGASLSIGIYNSAGARVSALSFGGTSIDYLQATGNSIADLYTFSGARWAEVLTFTSAGAFQDATVSDSNMTGFVNGPRASVLGHGSICHVVGINPANAAQGIVGRTEPINSSNKGTYGTSVLKNPVAVGIVVAPEPGSMVALAIGAMALLRRRRA